MSFHRRDALKGISLGAGSLLLTSVLTNVLTISSGAGVGDFAICFTGLGFKKGKQHLGHGGSENGMTW